MSLKNREYFLKKILYKSCYRGCRETDKIIGEYAKRYASKMPDSELMDFSQIIEYPDTDFYDWYTGKKEIPEDKNSAILQKLMNFSPS